MKLLRTAVGEGRDPEIALTALDSGLRALLSVIKLSDCAEGVAALGVTR